MASLFTVLVSALFLAGEFTMPIESACYFADHEVLKTLVPLNLCDRSCPNKPDNCLLPFGACICAPGYYRNEDNKCVLKEDCTCDGDFNAVYTTCVNPCPRTCGNKDDPPPILCIGPIPCPSGCNCKNETYVLSNGKCINKNDCPVTTTTSSTTTSTTTTPTTTVTTTTEA